jgi:hypothetical protein
MADDFAEHVKRTLALRAGNLCSNPNCRAPTSGPQIDPAKAMNVGVAAHITAASPGGVRYDPSLSPEQRAGHENGIWLCQTDAKLVDNDPARYTVDVLQLWKRDTEQEALDRIGRTAAAPPKQEPPVTNPVPSAKANLKIEATKISSTIYLRDDIWTLSPGVSSRETPYRALFVDVANVPTPSWNIKSVTVRAALTIQSSSYSPLPWIDEFTNATRLEPAARKSAILAVGQDRPFGSWYFVLNHRDNRNSVDTPSRMDWTNMAPIPSGMPMEIAFVDVNNGELIAKFDYIWTFDANLNWPILKTPR